MADNTKMSIEKKITGHSFICEGKTDISARDITDMLGLSRIFKGKVEEYRHPPPESENLSAEIYTESCEICGGRSRADKDHVEDLVQRCALSNSPHPVYFLHKHWPHFAEFNRLMQFHCALCRLHFRGARSLAVHLYLHHQNVELNKPRRPNENRYKQSRKTLEKQSKSSVAIECKIEYAQEITTAESIHNGTIKCKTEPTEENKDCPADEAEENTEVDEEDEHCSDDEVHQKEEYTEAEFSVDEDAYNKVLVTVDEKDSPVKCDASKEKKIHPGELTDAEIHQIAEERCKGHAEIYSHFLNMLKGVCDKTPNESMISTLGEFLCPNSPNYYKIAYLNGTYDNPGYDDGSGYYDTLCVNYMELQKHLYSAVGESADSCEWPCELPVVQEKKDPLKSFYGLNSLKTQLSQVLMNRLDELNVSKSVEGLELSNEEFELQHYNNPFRPEKSRRWAILKCACCEEPIHSIRMHLTEVLWLHWPSNNNALTNLSALSLSTPWSHVSLILRTTNLRFLGTNLHCPVCQVHFGDSRSILFLIYHLRIHGGLLESSSNKPNEFMMRHIRLMNDITDILVDRVVGDISIKKAGQLLNQKFACKEGFYYWLRPNVNSSKINRPSQGQRSSARGRGGGIKRTRTEDLFASNSLKRQRVGGPSLTESLKRFPVGSSRQRALGTSSWSFESNSARNIPRPLMPRIVDAPFAGRQPSRPQAPVSLLSIPYQADRFVTCELCNTHVEGERGLSVHLLQTLFRLRSRPDGLRIAERHLMCFPGLMVYRQRALCPACKLSFPSLDTCMAHINLGQGQEHRAIEQKIISYYINCMAHRINLDTVIGFLKSEFCIRD